MLMSPIVRATSSLKRKHLADNGKAIEMSLSIGNSSECSCLLQHGCDGGFLGSGFGILTLNPFHHSIDKGATHRIGNPRKIMCPF